MEDLHALLSDRQHEQMQTLRAALEARHEAEQAVQQVNNGDPRDESNKTSDAV